jgi:hypothetical protein
VVGLPSAERGDRNLPNGLPKTCQKSPSLGSRRETWAFLSQTRSELCSPEADLAATASKNLGISVPANLGHSKPISRFPYSRVIGLRLSDRNSPSSLMQRP